MRAALLITIISAILLAMPATLRAAGGDEVKKEGQLHGRGDLMNAIPSEAAKENPKPRPGEIVDIARSVPEVAYAQVNAHGELVIACKGECRYRTAKAVQEKLNDKGISIRIRILRGNAQER
ncbi:MAG: hypothetical protein M1497_08325 [Nitrospirae bacterium]|nr:hypothetical protein [Nitrospirota bacterium]